MFTKPIEFTGRCIHLCVTECQYSTLYAAVYIQLVCIYEHIMNSSCKNKYKSQPFCRQNISFQIGHKSIHHVSKRLIVWFSRVMFSRLALSWWKMWKRRSILRKDRSTPSAASMWVQLFSGYLKLTCRPSTVSLYPQWTDDFVPFPRNCLTNLLSTYHSSLNYSWFVDCNTEQPWFWVLLDCIFFSCQNISKLDTIWLYVEGLYIKSAYSSPLWMFSSSL